MYTPGGLSIRTTESPPQAQQRFAEPTPNNYVHNSRLSIEELSLTLRTGLSTAHMTQRRKCWVRLSTRTHTGHSDSAKKMLSRTHSDVYTNQIKQKKTFIENHEYCTHIVTYISPFYGSDREKTQMIIQMILFHFEATLFMFDSIITPPPHPVLPRFPLCFFKANSFSRDFFGCFFLRNIHTGTVKKTGQQ